MPESAHLHQIRAGDAGHHDLGDEVADGRGWLFGLQFGQDVTLVLSSTRALLRHEPEHTTGEEQIINSYLYNIVY